MKSFAGNAKLNSVPCEQLHAETAETTSQLCTNNMIPDQNWRTPNDEEMELLIKDEVERFGVNEEEAAELVANCYAVVLDNFRSGSPGYSGRILFVIFGYPSTADMFMFSDDMPGVHDDESKLVPIDPEWSEGRN